MGRAGEAYFAGLNAPKWPKSAGLRDFRRKAKGLAEPEGCECREQMQMNGDRVTDSTHNAPKPDSDTGAEAAGVAPSRHVIDTQLRSILCDVLGLNADDVETFDGDTGLFGHLPELDSMAVAGLLTEMEDRMDIIIDDDDVDGEMLETFGGLLAFAEAKAITG